MLWQYRQNHRLANRRQFQTRKIEPLALDVIKLLEHQDELVQKARKRAGHLAHRLKTPLTFLTGLRSHPWNTRAR